MKNFRYAYTMVELIFVIVIVGILASMAMVKFSAIRDGAVVITEVTKIKQAIQDMGTHCITQGKFGKWKDMTSLKLTSNQKKSKYVIEGEFCIVFKKTDTNKLTAKINNKGYRRSKMCKLVSDELIKLNLVGFKKGVEHTFCGTAVK